jgi:predicted amidohydrolase
MTTALSLALWPMHMGLAPRGPAEFVATVATQIERARREGAFLLVMPEYACEAWLSFAPPDLPEAEEIPWLAGQAGAILPELASLAKAAGVGLLAGTVPSEIAPGRYRNRAHLLLPDGRCFTQDKLSLTPDERDPEAWLLEPGERLDVLDYMGLRIAIVICLDIEQPALAARLQGLDLDLVLVPSDTGLLSGHARVFSCAKARAVELYCAVAAVGGVGAVPLRPPRGNVSGAAVYLPCEAAFGSTGVLAEAGPWSSSEGAGELVLVRDVPVAALREARQAGGEVWLGAWPAERVAIGEAVSAPAEPHRQRATGG